MAFAVTGAVTSESTVAVVLASFVVLFELAIGSLLGKHLKIQQHTVLEFIIAIDVPYYISV
ncbi:hypothetical protein TUM4641_26290 [Shewanella morhuae]|nr:hypothetical protein TUM4641_26290 [Shewanella morhuae]